MTKTRRWVGRAAGMGVLAAGLAGAAAAQAQDDIPLLTMQDHHFVPDRLEVPAHKKFELHIKNADSSAEEFESSKLKREKVVPAGQTVSVFLGPLEPGEYHFVGEYHENTAKGVIVAQ